MSDLNGRRSVSLLITRYFEEEEGIMKSRLLSCLIVIFCLVAVLSCQRGGNTPQQEANEIVIGEFGSLTGTTATFGISTRNGIDLAIDEVNAAGGILGKKVRVIVED